MLHPSSAWTCSSPARPRWRRRRRATRSSVSSWLRPYYCRLSLYGCVLEHFSERIGAGRATLAREVLGNHHADGSGVDRYVYGRAGTDLPIDDHPLLGESG